MRDWVCKGVCLRVSLRDWVCVGDGVNERQGV